MKISTGDKAPAFTLADQDGKIHSLSDYLGNWVLLYFYPKDDTPGCTTEACELRDNFSTFTKYSAVVLGVSGDSGKSHSKFRNKYTLPFPLLADTDKEVMTTYGVYKKKSMMGKTFLGIHRTSFLIDPKGNIAKVYENVKPADHAKEVLSDIATRS